jgi:tRNA U54 and U55 pseudouridine synthase Pus10
MRYALCTATDQLLSMLGRWIRKAINEANSRVSAVRPDLKAQMRDFATAVKAIATDKSLTHDELVEQLCALADAALKQETPSRVSPVRS